MYAIYTDDTGLHACDKEVPSLWTTLEHETALTIEWFESNYMNLNTDKCHLIAGHNHWNSYSK